MREVPAGLITVNPDICGGQPCFRGTRIMAWIVLELLEAGYSPKQIHKEYPTLPKNAIPAALHYAAETIKGERYDRLSNA